VYLKRVRHFFHHLVRRGMLLVNPAQHLALPHAVRLPKLVLSESEAGRLMTAPFPYSPVGMRDRALLETLYGTGIRRSECLRLDVGDLDLGRGSILVRDGKGRRDRVVPVPGRAASALDVYLRDVRPLFHKNPRETALFLTCFGTRPGKSILDLIVRQHGRAARIARPISPHALRHACATHLLQGGASVRHVQELLGHKSLQTTAIYTRVALRDLAQILARAHPRERPWRKAPGDTLRPWRRP
jgi:integrase/recombinase XerD